MEIHSNRSVLFGLAAAALSSGGCSMLWKETPSGTSNPPKVVLDAAWYSENPSKEIITRLADERRQHIDQTIAQRKQGNVSLTLDQVLGDGKAAADSDRVVPPRTKLVLTADEKTADQRTVSGESSDRESPNRESQRETDGTLLIKIAKANSPESQ